MREIKFRQYYEGTDDSYPEWNYFDLRHGGMVVDGGWLEPQQFTGLLDKNGVEIYEGDICHFKNRWDGEYTHAIVYYKNGFYLDDGIHSNWDAEDCEVIGNIYENPELLNGKNEVKR